MPKTFRRAKSEPTIPAYMSTHELAEVLGISPQRIVQLIHRLPPDDRPRMVGRSYVIERRHAAAIKRARRPNGRPRSAAR